MKDKNFLDHPAGIQLSGGLQFTIQAVLGASEYIEKQLCIGESLTPHLRDTSRVDEAAPQVVFRIVHGYPKEIIYFFNWLKFQRKGFCREQKHGGK